MQPAPAERGERVKTATQTDPNRPPTGERDDFRADIEGLRGIAIVLVVLFHAGLLSGTTGFVSGGFIGVDLFFVVSGFLITGLLVRERERTGRVSFTRFYARRVRRILPAATVVLLVTIPISFAVLTLIQRPSAMADAAAAALSFANVRFGLTIDYFNPTSYSPFLHFWSLGVEEQFYLVWPALFAVAAWRGSRLGLGVVLAAVIGLSLAASLYVTDQNPSWAFYMLPTRAWQLAAGGLLAVAGDLPSRFAGGPRLVVDRLPAVVGWAALAGLLVDAWMLDSAVAYPGLAAVVPTAAGVALIATGAGRVGPGILLRAMPVRFFGKISYSLYLWHWPALILGGLWLNGSLETAGGPDGAPQMLNPGQAAALVVVAILLATASWALVEEPFRRGRIPLPRPSRVVAAGLATMLIVAIAGSSMGLSAQDSLANLSDPGGVAAVDTPSADIGPTDGPSGPAETDPDALPSFDPEDLPTIDPGPSASGPTASPALTPALTPALVSPPPNYRVTNALRPHLVDAPTDFEPTWRQKCLVGTAGATPPAAGKCVYGDPQGSYVVALIGDSHASAFFPAVNAVARAHGWKLVVYLKMDCPFIDAAMTSETLKREYTECENWNARVLTRLRSNPPDLAIVHMNRYIQGVGGPISQGNAIGRELKKIPAATRAVMVTDVPYPWNMDIPTCLSSHRSDYRQCAYARRIGLNGYWGQRESVASRVSGVPLISTLPWICPGNGACPAVIEGVIVFRDKHHLTATFATTLGPKLDAALVGILTAPPPGAAGHSSAAP